MQLMTETAKFVCDEILTSQSRVAGDAVNESAEDGADTDTSTSQADGGSTSAVGLRSREDGGGGRLDDDTAGLHGVADHGRGEGIAAAVEQQAVAAVDKARGGVCGDDRAWDSS